MSKSTEKVDKRLRAEMKRRRKGKGEEVEKKGGEGYQREKTRRKLPTKRKDLYQCVASGFMGLLDTDPGA